MDLRASTPCPWGVRSGWANAPIVGDELDTVTFGIG